MLPCLPTAKEAKGPSPCFFQYRNELYKIGIGNTHEDKRGMNMKVYETERLRLRQIDENWTEEVLDYFIRNRSFLTEWEAHRSEKFYTLDFQRKFLQEDFKANEEGTTLKLWITKKDDERKIIGCISFSLIVRGILQSCILGYKLDQDEVN